MKFPPIRSKSVIVAAIGIGMFLSLTTTRSAAISTGAAENPRPVACFIRAAAAD